MNLNFIEKTTKCGCNRNILICRLLICMSPRNICYDSTVMPRQQHSYIEKLFGFSLVEIVLAVIAKSVLKYSRLIIKNKNKLNFTTKTIVFFFVFSWIFYIIIGFNPFQISQTLFFTLKKSKWIKIKKKTSQNLINIFLTMLGFEPLPLLDSFLPL